MPVSPGFRAVRWTALACLVACAGSVWAADPPAGGAKVEADKLWSFQSPRRSPVPVVRDRGWVRNPIDAFILARLEAAGLSPRAEASRATLIRRLYFDLIGLPPTPEEIAAFEHDRSPDAYGRLVDRLLASPRYGERWATYWLDLVRFAESDGFKADGPRPTAWRYRDYVIRSLNQDKPYDRFISEQLAGDELYPDDTDALLATGYLRHYPEEYNQVRLELRRQEILNDITDTTGQVFLGVTLGCARCHDHKFDPIAQEDYYRLQAFFAAFRPIDAAVTGRDSEKHYRQRLQQWEAKTADVRRRMRALEEPVRQKFVASRKSRFPKEYQAMYDLPPQKRSPFQQQVASLVAAQLQMTTDELTKGMKPDVRKEWQALAKELASFERLKPAALPSGLAMTDVGPQAPPTYLLRRGELTHKGKELSPGFLSALDSAAPAIAPAGSTTGRRAALARWLTRPDHPLTARVMVNRLWQHHFGRGIVATPSDFGTQGDAPTYPELLDWLACEFTARGWSLKAMHRLMVTSATYRQSSLSGGSQDRAAQAVDPDNRLLWRMNRRRLEGEALRDAMLAVSGRLHGTMSGPSVFPELPSELSVSRAAWPVNGDPAERDRRSVYVFVKRNLRYPLFSMFDAPDASEPCARRNRSTTAPQALMLLNSPQTLEIARAFAGRVLREVGADPEAAVERAHRLALGHAPAAGVEAGRRFVREQAALLRARATAKEASPGTDPALTAAVVDLCHVLLNVNEFLYVD